MTNDNSVAYMERFNEFKKKLKGSYLEKMQKATQAVRTETLKTLSGNRKPDPDRIYFVPGTKRKYQASSPGEAPASATGTLRQHVKTEITVEERTIVGGVGTDVIYGPWLEFSTSNMEARPWLRPSFEKAEAEVKEILGESIT
jgi:hypothetical protein